MQKVYLYGGGLREPSAFLFKPSFVVDGALYTLFYSGLARLLITLLSVKALESDIIYQQT